MRLIVQGDNVTYLKTLEDKLIDLIYIDPPFNTGKVQKGKKCQFEDSFEDFIAFITPSLLEAHRVLKDHGSLFVHLDYREIHYCKVLLDQIFGRGSYINEIIWAYDYGARQKKKWPTKHDTILWYAKDPKNYTFNIEDMERIPYMAPGLVGAKKAARGKLPTDTWWHTIVPTNGSERTGYPTQKPLGILNRIVKVHSKPGDLVMDFFAGSGSFGEAAAVNNRNFILVDNNPDAIEITKNRLSRHNPVVQIVKEIKEQKQ